MPDDLMNWKVSPEMHHAIKTEATSKKTTMQDLAIRSWELYSAFKDLKDEDLRLISKITSNPELLTYVLQLVNRRVSSSEKSHKSIVPRENQK